MEQVRSRLRDLRISNKILLSLSAAMLLVMVVTSLVAGYWVSRSIERGMGDRLVDSRRSAALTIHAWERDTESAVTHLAEHVDDLSGRNAATTLAALVDGEPRQRLDYAEMTLADGTVFTAGSAVPQAPAEPPPAAADDTAPDEQVDDGSAAKAGQLSGVDTRVVETPAGWALESSYQVDVPQYGAVRVRGGRLLTHGLMDDLRTAVGDQVEVALTVDGHVVATSGPMASADDCNACHEKKGVVSAVVGDPTAPPTSVDMEQTSYLMLHAPLTMHDDVIGAYTVHLPMDTVFAAQNQARTNILGIGLVVFAVVVGAQGMVSRSIARPITRLAEASQEIAAGNLDRELETAGRDEIGVLSDSVATLTRNLAGQIRELSLLQEASLAANSSLELDEVLESIMESATEVLGADAGSIMLLDRSCTTLEVKAARGPRAASVAKTATSVASGPAGWVVRNRRPLLLPDDLEDPHNDLVLSRPDISSSVLVPIETRDACLGVLNLNMFTLERRFDRRTMAFAQTLAHHSALAIDKARHHQEVNDLYNGLIRALASAIDAKDPYTYGHSEMVHRYAAMIGAHMGLDGFLLKGLETAAYLHDIGKIGVKDAVLSKPSRLTPDERRVVEAHPAIGAQILDQIDFPWPVIDAVRHHHERWDGEGYPARLAGAGIPLHARVLAVADSFDAMTSDRPYRLGRDFEEALREVVACSGSQFDPEVVEAFIGIQVDVFAVLETSRATRTSAA